MLLQVSEFRQWVEGNMNGFIDELQTRTGRYGESERKAWQRSLPPLSRVLSSDQLSDFHLHLGTPGAIAIEYRLPASSAWCDAVLLGAGDTEPTAVMIELKDWDTRDDVPGPRPGLIRHLGRDQLHPSEQVRGYVEYTKRFHSAVLEQDAEVKGCVFFTRAVDLNAYRQSPHNVLADWYPLFSGAAQDLEERLPDWLSSHLRYPDPAFAKEFERGSYRQDRNFVRQVARSIESPSETQFVLLDEQREGFELCLAAIDELLTHASGDDKAVVIVEGPPGSGKSVLAAHLWAALVHDERIEGSVVMTTTSGSQRSNWEHMFEAAAEGPAGRGLVLPANQYNPGLYPKQVKELRDRGYEIEVETWRDNVKLMRDTRETLRMPDDSLAVSIVDESHALIDPTAPGKRGVPPSGWSMHMGPQAWHIMRASRLSIFLLDTDQSYRDNESTARAQLEEWAQDHGASSVRFVSLGEAQFRCGGSKEYVDWVDGLLGLRTDSPPVSAWRKGGDRSGGAMVFQILDDPAELDDRLREKVSKGDTARLLASYGRRWVTKGVYQPHELPPAEMDFHLEFEKDGEHQVWSRIWNYAPNQDYTLFVQGADGSVMAENPLAEVGCPYVVRGFDYDWIGLLWLSDLVWRNGEWKTNLDEIHETAWNRTLAAARKEQSKGVDGPKTAELLVRVKRGYRILLTRAIRGVFVWVEDPETRRHLEEVLNQ